MQSWEEPLSLAIRQIGSCYTHTFSTALISSTYSVRTSLLFSAYHFQRCFSSFESFDSTILFTTNEYEKLHQALWFIIMYEE